MTRLQSRLDKLENGLIDGFAYMTYSIDDDEDEDEARLEAWQHYLAEGGNPYTSVKYIVSIRDIPS